MLHPTAGLDGPSIPVRVEPIRLPATAPPERTEPAPREPAPAREPEKVPA